MRRQSEGADSRILDEAECDRIGKHILAACRGGGETDIRIQSWWSGDVRWGRNRVTAANDRRDVAVIVSRHAAPAGIAVTNQTDAASLDAVVRAAERIATLQGAQSEGYVGKPRSYTYRPTAIWSDATAAGDTALRRDTCRAMIASAEAKSMLSAGYVEHRLGSRASYDSWGRSAFASYTLAQCSTTVRNEKGTGSGWAGLSSYDWAKIDPAALANRALDKCLASRDPVALEPGRYTAILEPQAVGDLLWMMLYAFNRVADESPPPFAPATPFQLSAHNSKLGLQVVDERVTISFDPSDPDLGAMPFGGLPTEAAFSPLAVDPREADWEPPRAATWIDKGDLTNLLYGRAYSLATLRQNDPLPFPPSFRMHGGTTTVQQMIESTTRGVLVTRFSPQSLMLIQRPSGLLSGVTRDGLWLIENGKISRPIKNFRITESPVFMLNNIEQIGPSEAIFSPAFQQRMYEPPTTTISHPRSPLPSHLVVPPLKVLDFSFSGMADAT